MKILSYLLLLLLWLLHFLPLPILRAIGRFLGRVLFWIVIKRRKIALINLKKCFPNQSEEWIKKTALKHFECFACAVLDRTLGWWASEKRLKRLIRLKGEELIVENANKPIIILAPHFVGLDAGGVAMAQLRQMSSMFSNQKNPVFNEVLKKGRMRFNQPILVSRQDGLRRIVKTLKQNIPFYYLPDMDLGRKESIFVPFFDVSTATVPAMSRLCRLTGAKVLSCITKQVKDGYEVQVKAPFDENFGQNLEQDTARMNAYIAEEVLKMPQQYFWLHKRFKTRPEGEPSFYE